MSQTARIGVLIVNLGTPDAPTTPAVRRYLREFLSDPRVIDLPAVPRWLLVNGVIAPFRAPKSAHAYRSIWTAGGSPLLAHGRALEAALTLSLGLPVALGMRYGNPSIAAAITALGEIDRLIVVPLYPQYASATTGSTLEAVHAVLSSRTAIPAITVLRPLVQYPDVLDAWADLARPTLEAFDPDAVLFSYHGLPERHLRAARESCLHSDGCCDRPDAALGFCYRAQCLATTWAIASRLDLPRVASSFQSRLGRDPWIRPYTDDVLVELAQEGVKRLAVMTPSFVADCLETLEEIGIRGAETFQKAGGEELRLLPCLNASPRWVEALTAVIRTAL